jgi:hypothetical protein
VGIDRIAGRLGEADLAQRLASDLSASDLSTFLLEVVRARASRIAPIDVLRRYRTDRFSRPGTASFPSLRAVEDALIEAVPEGWGWIVPSPVVPFAAHAALGDVPQDWVVTTVRADEVAADPTVALALEAAAARSDSSTRRSGGRQRLATIQRVLRAQLYRSPDAFAHFTIGGLVTAGRSQAGNQFDVDALNEHLGVYVATVSAIVDSVELVVSVADTSDGQRLLESVRNRWAGESNVRVEQDPKRLTLQRYYRRACFKINAVIAGRAIEFGDGGFTDWTERLLDDRHERLLISGAGLDRLALAIGWGQSGSAR